MFQKWIKYLFIAIISIGLIFPTPVFAGEPMAAGTTLTEDSYVFTEDEAKRLFARIEELEQKEATLVELKEFIEIRELRVALLEEQLEVKDQMLAERIKMFEAAEKRIADLERYTRFRPLEDAGFALLGAATVIGLIFAVDAVEDRIEMTGLNPALQQRRYQMRAGAQLIDRDQFQMQQGPNFNFRVQVLKVKFR